MVVGGISVAFIGEIAIFDSIQSANEFKTKLKQAVEKNRTGQGTTYAVRVVMHVLDRSDIVRYATELGGQPSVVEALAFLNKGAVHACGEFGISYVKCNPSTAPFPTLPSWASTAIDATYRSAAVFAGRL